MIPCQVIIRYSPFFLWILRSSFRANHRYNLVLPRQSFYLTGYSTGRRLSGRGRAVFLFLTLLLISRWHLKIEFTGFLILKILTNDFPTHKMYLSNFHIQVKLIFKFFDIFIHFHTHFLILVIADSDMNGQHFTSSLSDTTIRKECSSMKKMNQSKMNLTIHKKIVILK